MSNQTGFDYEVMISRLHGGLCAFQSLRAHRRQRVQAAAPTAEAHTNPEPRVAHVDERVAARIHGSIEPQAFVAVGDRVVPLFADANAGLFGAMAAPSAPQPTPAPPPAAPPPAPPPTTAEPKPPAPAPSPLRLPPPTPPQGLGVIYGGRPPPPEPPPTAPPTDPPVTSQPPGAGPDAPKLAPIAALLDARAQEDAQRLERAHADHRAAMAVLLREHRDELRAQSEADSARTTALLREVFAQHRAELRAQSEADAARTTELLREIHAQHRAELAQVLAQRADASDTAEMRAALLEQANVQRETNEGVAGNLDTLTAIVADLGQTVGMLAVAATQKAHQGHLQARTVFIPPPGESATVVAPTVAPPVQSATTVAPPLAQPVRSASPPPANSTGRPAPPASSAATCATANQPTMPLKDRLTKEPAHARPISWTIAQEAAERARVEQAVDDDRDDSDLPAGIDDQDDPIRPRRLAPISRLDHPDADEQEPGDD